MKKTAKSKGDINNHKRANHPGWIMALFFVFMTHTHLGYGQVKAGVRTSYMIDTINNINMELASIDNELNVYVARKGYNVGVFTAFEMGRFSVRPELLYTVIEQNFRPPYILVRIQNVITNFTSTQWETPILLGYQLSDYLQIFAAPKWVVNQKSTYQNVRIPDLDRAASMELDLGFSIQMGALGLDIRYSHTSASSGAYFLQDPIEGKNQYIQSQGKYLHVGLSLFLL